MANKLHCDCCGAIDGTNLTVKSSKTNRTVASAVYKVWHGVTFHGHTIDICNICLEQVEAVLGFELFDKKPKPTPKASRFENSNLECGKCHHKAHEPNKCDERVCDAAGDMDWCPC